MGLLTLALHGAVIYWVSQRPVPVLPIVPPEVPPMSLGFSLPAPGSSANAAYLKTPALLKLLCFWLLINSFLFLNAYMPRPYTIQQR